MTLLKLNDMFYAFFATGLYTLLPLVFIDDYKWTSSLFFFCGYLFGSIIVNAIFSRDGK